MKFKVLTTILLVTFSLSSSAQFTFSVSPGLGLNSANVGYRVNPKMVPFFGLQILSVNGSYEETGKEFDSDKMEVTEYTYLMKYSLNAIMPTLGLKYFLSTNNQIKSYATVSISKPFVMGSGEDDGETDEDFEEAINSVNIIGSEIGYGCEYYFNEQFSIGGEFGLRLARVKVENSYESTFFNPMTNDSEPTTITETVKVGAKPTYTRFSLNFYF